MASSDLDYSDLCSKYEQAMLVLALATRAWYREIWKVAHERGRIRRGEDMIDSEMGREQLRLLADEYVALGIMPSSSRDAVSRAQTAVYEAQQAIEGYERASWESADGNDIADLEKVEWSKVAELAQRTVEFLSKIEQALAKRKEMGVPTDQLESLELARTAVLDVVKAERRKIWLLRSPQLSDPTLLEFYQNAAVTDWPERRATAVSCLNLARDMFHWPVTEVAERSDLIHTKISDEFKRNENQNA